MGKSNKYRVVVQMMVWEDGAGSAAQTMELSASGTAGALWVGSDNMGQTVGDMLGEMLGRLYDGEREGEQVKEGGG